MKAFVVSDHQPFAVNIKTVNALMAYACSANAHISATSSTEENVLIHEVNIIKEISRFKVTGYCGIKVDPFLKKRLTKGYELEFEIDFFSQKPSQASYVAEGEFGGRGFRFYFEKVIHKTSGGFQKEWYLKTFSVDRSNLSSLIGVFSTPFARSSWLPGQAILRSERFISWLVYFNLLENDSAYFVHSASSVNSLANNKLLAPGVFIDIDTQSMRGCSYFTNKNPEGSWFSKEECINLYRPWF